MVEAVAERDRLISELPGLTMSSVTLVEIAPTFPVYRAVEAEPTIPAYRPDGEHAPTQNGHGRNPTLVFGLADHIVLARRRRSQSRTTLPHQKNRTEVLSTPATSETSEPHITGSSGVVMLSLWDMTAHTDEDAADIALPVPASPLQRPLWAE